MEVSPSSWEGCVLSMCSIVCLLDLNVQWNLSDLDTIGPEESVLIKEVPLFQRLKCAQALNLGWEYVSCLEMCH